VLLQRHIIIYTPLLCTSTARCALLEINQSLTFCCKPSKPPDKIFSVLSLGAAAAKKKMPGKPKAKVFVAHAPLRETKAEISLKTSPLVQDSELFLTQLGHERKRKSTGVLENWLMRTPLGENAAHAACFMQCMHVCAPLHFASLAVMRIPWWLFVFAYTRIGEPFVQASTKFMHVAERAGPFCSCRSSPADLCSS
jgi:hypothetical protein